MNNNVVLCFYFNLPTLHPILLNFNEVFLQVGGVSENVFLHLYIQTYKVWVFPGRQNLA